MTSRGFRLTAPVLIFLLAFAPALVQAAARDDDDQEELARKILKKMQKAFERLEEAQEEAAEERAKALEEFSERVAEYVELHQKMEGKLAKLQASGDPRAVGDHRRGLADLIRRRRKEARPGDVFVGEVQPLFRRLIHAELEGPEGAPARQAAREGNPPEAQEEKQTQVSVAVNANYPESAPVSTVPPSVLMRLPTLPPELEYRFVGRTLILRDTTASLIVDFLPDAAPPLGSR